MRWPWGTMRRGHRKHCRDELGNGNLAVGAQYTYPFLNSISLIITLPWLSQDIGEQALF